MSAVSACQKLSRLHGQQSKLLFRCFDPSVKPALQSRHLQGEVKVYLGCSPWGEFSPMLCMHIGFLLQNKAKRGLRRCCRVSVFVSPAWQPGSARGGTQLPAFICPQLLRALRLTWWILRGLRGTYSISCSSACSVWALHVAAGSCPAAIRRQTRTRLCPPSGGG